MSDVLNSRSKKDSNSKNYTEDNFQEEIAEIPNEILVSAEPFEITSSGLQVLKDAVLEANSQRNLLSKDLKKIRFKLFFQKF